MTVRIGDWEFDSHAYDAEADVLYLSIGEPQDGYGEETPEGHILRFDNDDEFCGLTLVNVRYLLDRGELAITLPRREETSSVMPEELECALA